jgi:hypothetical protein
MFNHYLPPSVYRRLPVIYVAAAIVLLFAPLSSLKWIAIGALAAAAWMTFLLRLGPSRDRQS